MFCSKCGSEIPDDSAFCPECGDQLAGGEAPQPVPGPITPAQSESGEVVSQGLKVGIIVVSLIIPLIGIIMGVIYLKDAHPEKRKVGKTWLWISGAAFVFWFLVTVGGGM